MNDEEIVTLFVVAAMAFAIGFKVAQVKAEQAQAAQVYPGTGADAMSWFAGWGGLGRT
jgi:hypothetical protein